MKESLFSITSTQPQRENWDNWSWKSELGSNLSGDNETIETTSSDACRDACEANKDCSQYTHDGEKCFISKAIRLGESKAPENEGQKVWRSGWHQGRVADWILNQNLCEMREFPTSIEHHG